MPVLTLANPCVYAGTDLGLGRNGVADLPDKTNAPHLPIASSSAINNVNCAL